MRLCFRNGAVKVSVATKKKQRSLKILSSRKIVDTGFLVPLPYRKNTWTNTDPL